MSVARWAVLMSGRGRRRSELPHGLSQVSLVYDVVAVEHRARLVPGQLHRHALKHRHILKPQFNPIFKRMEFLAKIEEWDAKKLHHCALELAALVHNLEMGAFYSEQVLQRTDPAVWKSANVGDFPYGHYREMLRDKGSEVVTLIVEMLDYQVWPDQESRPH
jgi:hypothetical protein